MDKFKDECGVFGIFGHPEAANMTYLGLYALQHRGQESAGIAASDGERVRVSRAMGYVADAFDSEALAQLPGPIAIGHDRYSTAGDSKLANAQPILIDCQHGQIALCHNGNLVNAAELRADLSRAGAFRNEIKVALGIGRLVVDGRRNKAVMNRQQRRHPLDGAGSPQGMADHGLG